MHIENTQSNKTKKPKINRTYTIDRNLFDKFQDVAKEDGRKLSNIIERCRGFALNV